MCLDTSYGAESLGAFWPLDGALAGILAKALDPPGRRLCWTSGSLIEHVADPGMAWCLREQRGEREKGMGGSLCLVSVSLFGSRAGREVQKRWGLCCVSALKRGEDSEPLWVDVP